MLSYKNRLKHATSTNTRAATHYQYLTCLKRFCKSFSLCPDHLCTTPNARGEFSNKTCPGGPGHKLNLFIHANPWLNILWMFCRYVCSLDRVTHEKRSRSLRLRCHSFQSQTKSDKFWGYQKKWLIELHIIALVEALCFHWIWWGCLLHIGKRRRPNTEPWGTSVVIYAIQSIKGKFSLDNLYRKIKGFITVVMLTTWW